MGTIPFEEYLSEDRKAEIAEAAFREFCEDSFRRDAERIFSNAAYEAVWVVVDDMFDGKAADMVAEKIPSLIENLSEYSVFRSATAYERKDSPGAVALKNAVDSHRAALADRVAHLATKITKQDVIELLLDGDLTLKVSAASND